MGPKDSLLGVGAESLGVPIITGTLLCLAYPVAGVWAVSVIFEGFLGPQAMFLPEMLFL